MSWAFSGSGADGARLHAAIETSGQGSTMRFLGCTDLTPPCGRSGTTPAWVLPCPRTQKRDTWEPDSGSNSHHAPH